MTRHTPTAVVQTPTHPLPGRWRRARRERFSNDQNNTFLIVELINLAHPSLTNNRRAKERRNAVSQSTSKPTSPNLTGLNPAGLDWAGQSSAFGSAKMSCAGLGGARLGGFELSWTEPEKEEGKSEAAQIGSESRVLGIGGAQGFREKGRVAQARG